MIGDPQFVGLLGQSFQVHGIDGAVYNLIIDHEILVNARFRYLSGGRCPVKSVESRNCWSHAGSYLSEIGVVSSQGVKLHIVSGGWDKGFDRVVLNGMVLSLGTNVSQGGIDVLSFSSYSMRLRVGNFELLLENSDHFVNIVETRVLHWSKLSSHGLLGQTWRRPTKAGGQVPDIEGDIDDYVEQNSDLMGRALAYVVE